MTEETKQALVKLFEDNIGNRITVALANGMLGEIGKLIEPQENPLAAIFNKDIHDPQ
jgi:hypothetical protein